jgi:hypothetical protein
LNERDRDVVVIPHCSLYAKIAGHELGALFRSNGFRVSELMTNPFEDPDDIDPEEDEPGLNCEKVPMIVRARRFRPVASWSGQSPWPGFRSLAIQP